MSAPKFTASSIPLAVALALAGVALPASAQVGGELTRGPTTGLDQPAPSAALTDGPQASVVNPAGLRFLDGLSLRYLHQEGSTGVLDAPDGDGLYLGGKIFAPIGWGVALEWLRNAAVGDDVRRTTWSLALGGETASIGAAVHYFSSDSKALDDIGAVDLGAMIRPARYLSVGFTVLDVDASNLNGFELPRRYDAALGLRPFGDWLTLAVDAEIPGGDDTNVDVGWDATTLAYTARAELARGVTLVGNLAHRVDGEGPVLGQVGLRVDFSHLGVEATPLLQSGGGAPGALVAVDLSAAAQRGVETHRDRVAVVDLDKTLASGGGFQLFPSTAREPMVDAIEGFHRLADDDGVDAVVVKIRSLPGVSLGEAYELRRALLDLRASGKKVVALINSASDTEYYVASAADRILAAPEGAHTINGFASRVNFYADTLQMIGVEVQAAKMAEYKNLPDSFTRREISEPQREVVNSLLDSLFETYVRETAASRGMDEARFREILVTGIQSSALAKELGLVDEIVWNDELDGAMERLLKHRVQLESTTLRAAPWTSWGTAPVIAVIPIEGNIVAGRGGGDFGLLETVGERAVTDAIANAAADPAVRAIVLRIDSGGGDAGGSQRIWRAVVKAREKKPVVASLGDAAASGGYYAAAGAARIFAAPTTITGSIGVFWLKPSFQGLLQNLLEVHTYSTNRGELAELDSIQKPWNEAEAAAVQRWVEAAYTDFLDAVAAGRGMTREAVHEVARGRVWTGAQARERKLVDDLGGLSEALRWARTEGGLSATEPVDYRVYRPSAALFSIGPTGASVETGALAPDLPAPLATALKEGLPAPLLLSTQPGLWALTPWSVEIR